MWEPVLTVNDYYDAPRFGIAHYNGVPHIYDSPFDERQDDYTDFYYLAPIDDELLQLILKDWAIWLRWEQAFHTGQARRDSHPCLPEDRSEHERLQALIGGRFQIVDRSNCVTRTAKFRAVSGSPRKLEVQWTLDRREQQSSGGA